VRCLQTRCVISLIHPSALTLSTYLTSNTQAISPMLVYTKCWTYYVQELDPFCLTYHLYHPTMIYIINSS
jgi:hypothetical protein